MSKTKDLAIELGEQQIAQEKTGLSLELGGLIRLSKKELSEKVSEAVNLVNDGYIEPIDAYIFAKKGEKMFKDLVEQVKPLAEEKNYEKGFQKFGTTVTESTQGAKTDYSGCGDTEWNDLNAKILDLTIKKKEREDFLKGVTKATTIVDNETGEIITINAPIKTGKAGITVTIK